MAIHINSEFEMGAPLPIDKRLNLTYTQMASVNDNTMPQAYLTICVEDGFIYVYNKNNPYQEKTGRFVKLGVDSDYSTQLVFSTHLEFPNIGQAHTLYIAEDENVTYRYDTTKSIYVALNQPEFDAIQSTL